MVNGQRKGSSFERDIAKVFEEKFGIQFRRTPQSGAYVGGQNRGSMISESATELFAGDLMVVDDSDWWPFCIECKNYNDEPKFHHLVQGASVTFNSWIEQATADADMINKIPMIVFKVKRKGTFIAVPQVPEIDLDMTDADYMCYNSFIIMSMDNFLKRYQYDS